MSKNFLLEIGMEELPAKFAPGAVSQMESNARKKLSELRLDYKSIKTYIAPRRLTLYIEQLAEKQEDISEEAKGPAQKAAYDAEGNPTKAAQGFARGQGVDVQELFIKELNGAPYVYAVKSLKGEDTETLLPQFCLDMIQNLSFPKPMRWGDYDIRFARPIRWLVSLYGDKVIPFSYAGLQAGRTSRGHRTLGGYVRLVNPEEYLEALEIAYVIADQERRREIISKQINTLATNVAGQVDEDDELLTEVSHLVEYPTALLGEVGVEYMILPEEVITTPMKEHQRYFPVRSGEGKLLPYFITVRNGDKTSLDMVKEGNKKVLKARLEDAAFYYREDLKKPLSDLVLQLDRVVYHEKLGTVGQRVERLRKLAGVIAQNMGVSNQDKESVDRTAFLAKADLVTNMVYDFPELQGIMGSYYARSNGEKKEVYTAIREHYQPRYTGDTLPTTSIGIAVSMADKLDAIVGSFGIGIQPTGSQDPYALRRQALGIVSMLIKDERNISLTHLLEESYNIFIQQGITMEPLEEVMPALEDFFNQRLRYILQEIGLRYDTIDAVLAHAGQQPYNTVTKAQVLAAKREEEQFTAYLNAYTRCVNLSKKAVSTEWSEYSLTDVAEIVLAKNLKTSVPKIQEAVDKMNYEEAYILAAELVPLIEQLFEAVMIMVEDEKLRNARLGVLQECVKALGCLGDLTLLA
ncbi:MAG: glycine--tRNA ligase subunit beta [Gracilibacter sp. BRH_c7a]|nr:MAG: glycine--tRNA ligase subunit beta [Gracilibacter sp. BRH_c7a]